MTINQVYENGSFGICSIVVPHTEVSIHVLCGGVVTDVTKDSNGKITCCVCSEVDEGVLYTTYRNLGACMYGVDSFVRSSELIGLNHDSTDVEIQADLLINGKSHCYNLADYIDFDLMPYSRMTLPVINMETKAEVDRICYNVTKNTKQI